MGRRGNGEGSIARRKDGLYMARYTVQTASGPQRKTIYAKTRQEASEKLTKAMAERDGGLVFDDENLSLGEYLDTWLKGLTGSVRQSTFDGYEIAVRVHIKPALGRLKLKKVTPAHVASFYQHKLAAGSAPASVNKLHVTLHKALDQAVKWNVIPRNVSKAVTAPRPASEEMRTSPRRGPGVPLSGLWRASRGPVCASRSHRDAAGRTAGPEVGRRGPQERASERPAHDHQERRTADARRAEDSQESPHHYPHRRKFERP